MSRPIAIPQGAFGRADLCQLDRRAATRADRDGHLLFHPGANVARLVIVEARLSRPQDQFGPLERQACSSTRQKSSEMAAFGEG
jgi:hypothetical protein